ncbi:gliding motility-associated C-terminal domain-containing protein [Aquimarina sp. W85]|uniref:T9SS type B sorting domain-containing protein n=1 Tax=Aquimarina rhodophyticola TaxID=3342246 RepID=UPI00366F1CE2
MNNKLNLTYLLLLAVLLISSHELVAQANRAISAPAFESGATQICASPGNDIFTVIASISSGPALDGTNQFILEVSAPDGTFGNSSEVIELARVNGPNGSGGGTIRFEDFLMDDSLSSDTYRLRIRTSTNDDIISSESQEIVIHYFDGSEIESIRLNDRKPIILCNTTSISRTLTPVVLDNDGNELNLDDFKWQWFSGDSSFDLNEIPGETESSYTITQEGTYAVKIDLGDCQPVFTASSNVVIVSIVDVSDVAINEGSAVSFCPQDAKVLTSSETDTSYDYQWFKNGTAIEGEISSTITLPDNDFGGNYTLQVLYSEDCTVTTDPIEVTNDGSSITETLPENLILLPSQILTLQIRSDAPDGSIVQWFVETTLQKQGPLTDGVSTFDASFVGRYRVSITANDACNSLIESRTEIFAPIGFESTIGGDSGSNCDASTVDISLQEMIGLTSGGLRVPLTQEQYAFFDFEWSSNGTATGDTETSLTVDTADQESIYQLNADLRTGEFTNIQSNEISVQYVDSGTEITITPNNLPFGGTVVLSVPQDPNYTYEWYRVVDEEEQLIEGENTNEITVSQEGDYFVRIASVICSLDTPIVAVREQAGLSGYIPNVLTPNGDGVNDTWNLPDELTDSPEVEVLIYDSRGQVALQTNNYRNGDWPNDTAVSNKERVYYFIITKNNSVIRKGSITVMR